MTAACGGMIVTGDHLSSGFASERHDVIAAPGVSFGIDGLEIGGVHPAMRASMSLRIDSRLFGLHPISWTVG